MWFKQAQILKLSAPLRFDVATLAEQLQPMAFSPCLPSLPFSCGWVSPFEQDDAALVHGVNGYMLICLQLEEKILPAAVVRQALTEKIKEIAALRNRKIGQKEKLALKDEIVQTLLPRAFSKLSRIYAYIDTRNNWLLLDSVTGSKASKFLETFKKCFPELTLEPLATDKISSILTRWLLQDDSPGGLVIEKSCVLADPGKKSRVIRCQQQDLTANGVQWMLKDGCQAQQLGLSWHDHVQFVLADDLSLRSIKFQDQVIAQAKEAEPETREQQLAADFFIMTEVLSALLQELAGLVRAKEKDLSAA